MLSASLIVGASFAYLAVLFGVALYGDRRADAGRSLIANPWVYAFSLAVYCTAWTYYGSVGRAATAGIGFLPVYLGPTLVMGVSSLVLLKMVRISKAYRITSIADFIASRYGKSRLLASMVTLVAVIGIVPYIALQLKAVSDTLLFSVDNIAFANQDMTLLVAIAMIMFTLIFGANRLDVSSYHSGIMVAIAFESLVKVIALIVIALFALGLSRGFDPEEISNSANIVFQQSTLTPSFWVLTLVSAATSPSPTASGSTSSTRPAW